MEREAMETDSNIRLYSIQMHTQQRISSLCVVLGFGVIFNMLVVAGAFFWCVALVRSLSFFLASYRV